MKRRGSEKVEGGSKECNDVKWSGWRCTGKGKVV